MLVKSKSPLHCFGGRGQFKNAFDGRVKLKFDASDIGGASLSHVASLRDLDIVVPQNLPAVPLVRG